MLARWKVLYVDLLLGPLELCGGFCYFPQPRAWNER